MPRLQNLLECVGRAVLAHGGPPSDCAPLGDRLLTITRDAQRVFAGRHSTADLRTALREAVAAPQETVELALSDAVALVAADRDEADKHALANYLELLPVTARQLLRRPGDPIGTSAPEQLPLDMTDDWLAFMPDRATRWKQGERLEAFDNWQVLDLRGFGPHAEVWRGWMPGEEEHATASLKFITDPAVGDFERHEDLFRRILDLEPSVGIVHLRSVYLLGDPPCLESAFVSGYDLTGLMRDWRWRTERVKADQAALIIKRLGKILGSLHRQDEPIVHRGLKPSNILVHPTADGKVSLWVSDLGWGEISTGLALEHTDEIQSKKQARRGALATLYASPQQRDGRPPDPRDDVYALGVIWHQLLRRDPSVPPPQGTEWALEFRKAGLTDGHARLLASCLDPNPDHRPGDGTILASQIDANFTRPPEHGSKTFQLSGTSASMKPLSEEEATAAKAKKKPVASVPEVKLEPRVTNSIGMEFVLIPAGSYRMGSPPEEKGRHDWEGPRHLVTISRPFYLGVHPVTQAQYERIAGRNPSHFTKVHGGGPDHPVEQVTWDEAITFCEKLIEVREEADECRLYRLPTEAEWEYACRAGTTTPYSFGETVSLEQVHYFGLSAATWSKAASTAGKTGKIGCHAPNTWGLCDMHGNVLEWCADWWAEDAYEHSLEVDPTGPADGWHRVARGGSFSQFAADCRSASRLGRAPGSKLNTVGFRIVMTIPGA